jgi:hypothetical protein
MIRDTFTPERCKELKAELSRLSELHTRATRDARCIGMSKEEAHAYDEPVTESRKFRPYSKQNSSLAGFLGILGRRTTFHLHQVALFVNRLTFIVGLGCPQVYRLITNGAHWELLEGPLGSASLAGLHMKADAWRTRR